jgi:hypothetical protein
MKGMDSQWAENHFKLEAMEERQKELIAQIDELTKQNKALQV